MGEHDVFDPEELERRRAQREARGTARQQRDEFRRLSEEQGAAEFQERVLRLIRTAPRADEELAVDTERANLQARRHRLVKAGVSDVDAIKALVPAKGSPALAGHAANAEAFRAADAFLADRTRRLLTLAGTTGVGKSWAACWVIAATDDAMWIPADDVRPGSDWDGTRARALRAPLVVLNDLSGRLSDWAAGEVSDLVCRRHDKAQRTVITTNLRILVADAERAKIDPRQSIEGRYGDRVTDRILDAQYSIVAKCVGPSIRRTPRGGA